VGENTYDSAIRDAALRYNVPFEFIKAIIAVESGFNPNAFRAEPQISDGSHGLMQILLRTARGEGFTGTSQGLMDPSQNVMYGTAYLASCLARTGTLAGAASMYNGGYRPDIGFGAPATRPVTVCLRYDPNVKGKCLESRNVPIGEYANQSYVNKVLTKLAYFQSLAPPGDSYPFSPPTSVPSVPQLSPKLVGLLVGLVIGFVSLLHGRRRVY
jgi:hypothetical protein